jgi:hypothetical protein
MNFRIRTLAAIAAFIALTGIGAWFFAKGSGEHAVGAGGLPLIRADTTPVKIEAEIPAAEIMPNADSTVFSAMSGEASDSSLENVKSPEVPHEVVVDVPPGVVRSGFSMPIAPEKRVESLFNDASAPLATIEPAAAPAIEPEPVAVAAEAEPVPVEEEPAAEPVAVADVPPEETSVSAAAEQPEDIVVAMVKPMAKPPVPASPAKKTGAVAAAPKKISEPVSKPAAKTAQPAAGRGYYIQLASLPATGSKLEMWYDLKNKYPGPLRGLQPIYLPVNVPGKGPYMRIQAGPMTEAQARERCRDVRHVDPKGGCLVLRR